MAPPKKRLDLICVEKGLAPSRQRAQALILAGKVLVNNEKVTKAGMNVTDEDDIILKEPDHPYVSRGGLKLETALSAFTINVNEQVALDIGASTGGFTDCLLQHGATHVYAIDVGYGQLDWKLRQHPQVTSMERCNARYLDANMLMQTEAAKEHWPPTVSTIDVSFISLELILPAVENVIAPESVIIALIKPQFEAEREDISKGGVVRDSLKRQKAIDKILKWAKKKDYQLIGSISSPITGPKGNLEELAVWQLPLRSCNQK